MKINQWTLGLAAAGVVSFGMVGHAEEAKEAVKTALSSTVLSGYVNTSIHYNLNQAAAPGYSYAGAKQNGFNLDVVNVTLEKALGEEAWAAGYKAELIYGADAGAAPGGLGTGSPIKQAYVNLRIPVGNGIDTKLGVFDTIIGYETFNAGSNPNYTRSWGYTVEPTQHTGLLGTYRFCEWMSLSAGLANTTSAAINARPVNTGNISTMAAVTLTAPKSTGALAGATLTAGYVGGRGAAPGVAPSAYNVYVGASVPLPVTGLSLGVSFDSRMSNAGKNTDDNVVGVYVAYQATKKLTLNGRAEYADLNSGTAAVAAGTEVLGATLTADYALWANVITRLEYRLDHDLSGGKGVILGGARNNAQLLALNVIYKF